MTIFMSIMTHILNKYQLPSSHLALLYQQLANLKEDDFLQLLLWPHLVYAYIDLASLQRLCNLQDCIDFELKILAEHLVKDHKREPCQ